MAEVILRSEFGRAMFMAVRVLHLRSLLEIGSFDGDGSTQVLISALKSFREKRLVCLELRRERYAKLKENTSAYPWVESHCAPSISWEDFTLRDFDQDIWPHFASSDPEIYLRVKGWWVEDTELVKSSQAAGYLESTTEEFDGVLIDGGEFSGYDEFRLLRQRAKCFLLDDVFKVFKNRRVFAELSDDPAWRLFYVNRDDRNGTAIFCRSDCMPAPPILAVKRTRALLEYAWNRLFLEST